MNSYLNHIPTNIKNSAYPLTKIDLKQLGGFQKEIPLFDGVNPEDIAFLTKRFETLNLFRGCRVNCSHCLKDAKPPLKGRETILYEDLTRFLDGFKALSERLGINVLQGNKYLNIIDDANPSDIPIEGKSRKHTVTEAIRDIYDKIRIPVLFVTSGWNTVSKYAQSSSEELACMIEKNPDAVKSVDISINPFAGIMDKSREALKKNDLAKAGFFREIYTSRMANTLKTFLKLFETGKAQIIYRHAPDSAGNEAVNALAAKKLYEEIYAKLKKMTGFSLEDISYLKPENLTKFDKSHLIESSGRGRRYFPQDKNLKEQAGLIDEALDWQMMSPQERRKTLLDCSVKCVDIDGSVYATMPSVRTENISAPIELTVPAGIQLNYTNKTPAGKVFSDIELD